MDSVGCTLGLYTTIRNLIYSIRIKRYRRIPKIFPHIPVVDEPLYIIWFYSGRGHCHRRYQQLLYYPVLLKTANGHSSKIFIGWSNNHLCGYYAQLGEVVDLHFVYDFYYKHIIIYLWFNNLWVVLPKMK